MFAQAGAAPPVRDRFGRYDLGRGFVFVVRTPRGVVVREKPGHFTPLDAYLFSVLSDESEGNNAMSFADGLAGARAPHIAVPTIAVHAGSDESNPGTPELQRHRRAPGARLQNLSAGGGPPVTMRNSSGLYVGAERVVSARAGAFRQQALSERLNNYRADLADWLNGDFFNKKKEAKKS